MKKFKVKSCEIFLAKELENKLPHFLKKWNFAEKYAIITDSTVKNLYGTALLKYLRTNGIEGEIFSFQQGEKSKTLKTIEKLAEEMVAKKFHRQDAIIALGGGVVGDMAGFLASIYMRGIPYIQIPTTLMAMVDSAIGGKTGVDLESGKNLLGRIEQPKGVFIDLKYLKTLPQKQIRNGLAEVIKYGVIKNGNLFNFIDKNLNKIFELNQKIITEIIEESINIKVKIVNKDQNEKNTRMLLNYGHTFGHVIEKMSGYKLLHGYAISIGMVMANKLAVEKGHLTKNDADRIKNLLIKSGLPVTTVKKPTKKDLLTDKKRIGKNINFVLPQKIGKAIIIQEPCP